MGDLNETDIQLTILLGVWYVFSIMLNYLMTALYFSVSVRFVSIIAIDHIFNKHLLHLGIFSVTVVLLLSNWEEYVNSYLIILNCVIYENLSLSRFIRHSQTVSIWPHSLEPLVIGLNF